MRCRPTSSSACASSSRRRTRPSAKAGGWARSWAWSSLLHGLFGFVPPEQREAALAVLRQLSPAQLAQLTLVAQRTPPQERDTVRARSSPCRRRARHLAQAPGGQ
jgi:formate dehydrogenase maturation protein FdhE